MPNAIKYSTTIPTGSLLKGTVALGVTTASISGPTSTTGWYYGPNPVAGKYQIIETAASGDPDVYCPQSDAELIQFVKTKGATGANTASLSASLAWIGTQSNLMAANFEYENIVTDGLVLNLDAGFVGSYPTINTTWYDISGNNTTGSLVNGPTYTSSYSGSIVFDGVDDGISIPNSNTLGKSLSYTTCAWVKYNNSGYTSWMMLTDSVDYGSGGGYMMWLNDSTPSIGKLLCSYDGNWQYGTVRIFPNTWTYVTITKDSNVVSFYVNGVFDVTRNYSFNNNLSITEVNIAYSSRNTGYRLNGNVGISQIYNRALSATEVSQNYNAQKGRFGL
jgi:hypothetical protein